MKDFKLGEKVELWVDGDCWPQEEAGYGDRLLGGKVVRLDTSDGSFLLELSDGAFLWFGQPSLREEGRVYFHNSSYLRRVDSPQEATEKVQSKIPENKLQEMYEQRTLLQKQCNTEMERRRAAEAEAKEAHEQIAGLTRILVSVSNFPHVPAVDTSQPDVDELVGQISALEDTINDLCESWREDLDDVKRELLEREEVWAELLARSNGSSSTPRAFRMGDKVRYQVTSDGLPRWSWIRDRYTGGKLQWDTGVVSWVDPFGDRFDVTPTPGGHYHYWGWPQPSSAKARYGAPGYLELVRASEQIGDDDDGI